MNARKISVAIIAGFATMAALSAPGSASADVKQPRSGAHTDGVVKTGQASKATSAKPPQLAKKASSRLSTAQRTGRTSRTSASGTAAVTRSCYSYSNGTGDLCLWYFQNYSGSRGGVYSSDSNLVDNYFATLGSGQYRSMTNNTESDFNYDYYYRAVVATSPGYYGYRGTINPRTGGNFNSTYVNNVESVYWT